MTSPTLRLLSTWVWTWAPGLALLALLAATGFDPFPEVLSGGEPANMRPGTLNKKAVDAAQTFRDFPVLWLGEEFQGYRLTAAQHDQFPAGPAGIPAQKRLILVYGSCASRDSCVPPIAVIVYAPGSLPVPSGGDIAHAERFGVRGLFSGFGENPTVWTAAGLAVEVQANAEVPEDILEYLTLANADAFGLPAIGPGESLAPLQSWKP